MTRPLVQSSSTAGKETASEQQLESDKDVYFHPPSSTYFWKDGLAGDEQELAKLVECLDKAPTAYGMEISAEKTKLMTNNTSGINAEIKVNGQKLETATSFR